MRDDFDSDIDNVLELESQPLDDDGRLPSDISLTDCADFSFELVSDSTPPTMHLGPVEIETQWSPCYSHSGSIVWNSRPHSIRAPTHS